MIPFLNKLFNYVKINISCNYVKNNVQCYEDKPAEMFVDLL